MKRRDTIPVPPGQVPTTPQRSPREAPVALRLLCSGREIPLPADLREFCIGSDPGNRLVLDDRYVSAFHCTLERSGPHGLTVRDRESRNGTFVNGIRSHGPQPVEPGTRIVVGATALSVVAPSRRKTPPAITLLVGEDPRFRLAIETATRMARLATGVVVIGESGTGKELVARLIHESSPRADKPFVALNCGAISRELIESELFGHERGAFTGATERRLGLFEQANGGTLFLDELGELPLAQQPRLLRVIETRRVRPVGSEGERPIDVRIVAATHRDLRGEIAGGEFRMDLYHRIACAEIVLPALRERPADIPLLVDRFLAEVGADHGARTMSPATLEALGRHPWPGNVRELRNAIHRAAVLSEGELKLADLLPARAVTCPGPQAVGRAPWKASEPNLRLPPEDGPLMTVDDMMRALITRALNRCGSYRRAAVALGISKSTIYDRARRLGI